MRLIQTLWSSNNPLQEHNFGWQHPEYNIMSWTLSCLSLREHYDEVVLYTDSEGARILVDKIGLPYTDVVIAYDNFRCLPQHWALAKVNTYNMQKQPFLHVDGDVYLPNPISEKIMQGALIAQNREHGTAYYKGMMDNLLSCQDIQLPDYLEEGLRKESISSFNLGFFGGYDLDFIHRYCDEAFKFLEKNKLNNPICRNSGVYCNLIFEQVFFAVLVDRDHRHVESVLGRTMLDEGYTAREFCDLYNYSKRQFFHILGGHKKNKNICNALEKTLCMKYPEWYKRIISLFPYRHPRMTWKKATFEESPGIYTCLAQYENFLYKAEKEWQGISSEELFAQAQKNVQFPVFLNATKSEQDSFTIDKNPYLHVFTIPSRWKLQALNLLRERLVKTESSKHFDVVAIPSMSERECLEIAISDLGYNVLLLLKDGAKTFLQLLKEITPCFSRGTRQDAIRERLMSEIAYMLYNGILISQK